MGRGFIDLGAKSPHPEDCRLARETYLTGRDKMLSGSYDMVILDEINCALNYGLLPVANVIRLIDEKPALLHLFLTGRNAPPEVVEAADLVTEMRVIKHPYQAGVVAQRGVEF